MKKTGSLILSIILLLLMCQSPSIETEAAAANLFVAPGAPPSGSCTRADPCDFRYALEMVAMDGDVVYARSGMYTSLDSSAVHLLQIYKTVSLFGSCTFDAATPVTCQTNKMDSILNGESERRVITAYGLGDEQIHIEGFAVENGIGADAPSTAGLGSFDGYGGGIYAKDLQSLTLKNVNVHHNYAGETSGAGGGLYAEAINFLSIENSIFTRNFATLTGEGYGGGMVIYDVGHMNPAIIHNNLINGNETSTDTDTPGVGMLVLQSNGVQITDNRFQNNNTENQRVVDGTSIYLGGSYNFLIQHNQFTGDWGDSVVHIRGGGLVDPTPEGSVLRNSWWQNDTYKNLKIIGKLAVDVENNFFGFRTPTLLSNNRGGSSTNIHISGDCLVGSAYVDILFNTFAAADYGLDVYECSSVLIDDNIFSNLTTKAIQLDLTFGPIQRSIIKNIFFDYTASDEIGTIPIFEDPKLANVSTGDFHLTHGSAAIDRERPPGIDIDIDGDQRPVGSGYDLGADEYCEKFYMPLLMK